MGEKERKSFVLSNEFSWKENSILELFQITFGRSPLGNFFYVVKMNESTNFNV